MYIQLSQCKNYKNVFKKIFFIKLHVVTVDVQFLIKRRLTIFPLIHTLKSKLSVFKVVEY